jgi:hypothetical protein
MTVTDSRLPIIGTFHETSLLFTVPWVGYLVHLSPTRVPVFPNLYTLENCTRKGLLGYP